MTIPTFFKQIPLHNRSNYREYTQHCLSHHCYRSHIYKICAHYVNPPTDTPLHLYNCISHNNRCDLTSSSHRSGRDLSKHTHTYTHTSCVASRHASIAQANAGKIGIVNQLVLCPQMLYSQAIISANSASWGKQNGFLSMHTYRHQSSIRAQ